MTAPVTVAMIRHPRPKLHVEISIILSASLLNVPSGPTDADGLDADALGGLLDAAPTLTDRLGVLFDLPGSYNPNLRRFTVDIAEHQDEIDDVASRLEAALEPVAGCPRAR